jgi:hypothetical protein
MEKKFPMAGFENQVITSPEKREEYTSKIELNFFRHGNKEADENKRDDEIRLNMAGRAQAINKSVALKNPKLAKAWGSPRVRSQETAVLIMDGRRNNLSAEANSDNLDNIANPGIMSSPRIVEDDRLDFQMDINTVSGSAALESLKKGEYWKWIAEQSDFETSMNGDLESNSSYSKSAANIASIIKQYYDASDRWDEIIKAEGTRKFPKGYSKELERFFGSHQGVTESFLLKVIEKTRGVDERNKLMKALGNQGFDFVEGFKIDIVNKNGNVIMILDYKKNGIDGEVSYEIRQEISKKILEDIINDENGRK